MEAEGKSFPNVKERRGMIKKFKVRVEGKEYSVEVESVEEAKGLKGTPGNMNRPLEGTTGGVKKPVVERAPLATKEKCVVAPMPGAVVKINCRPGEMVKKGDQILKLSNTNLLLDIMWREAEVYDAENRLRSTRLQMEQNSLKKLRKKKLRRERKATWKGKPFFSLR